MKKIIFCFMATILSLAILPTQSFASTKEDHATLLVTTPKETSETAEAKALKLRLDEIKAMDKTKLKSTEKKDLRKETRAIERKLKNISGGVYISAGALIVILILLIILM